FHVDESLVALEVESLDGANLHGGGSARITATVWGWGAGDSLDLYFADDARNPVWQYLATIPVDTRGEQALTYDYALSFGATQAIRGNFRYSGSAGACTDGPYDDRDD